MAIEHTFVMVKPDGVKRGLIGDVIARFERKGFRLEKMRLLTIDRELAGRRGVRALLIDSQSLDEQLAQVTAAFPPPPDTHPGRCPVCNSALVQASREEVAHRIPAYVARRHSHFQHCQGCDRIYWRGSHWRNMQARLRGIPE